jgi:hypothetical protein
MRWNGYASSSRIRSPRKVRSGEDVAVNLRHAERVFVEVEELLLVGDVDDPPVEAVAPAVVLAREEATVSARLFLRVLLPYDLVAAVGTDVVERVDLAFEVARHDDRGQSPGQLAGEVGARTRQPLDAADVEPRSPEHGLALRGEELG